MVKAIILDFDGTLVNKDILDVVCGIVGKENESRKINEQFHSGKRQGLDALVERINLLKGVTNQDIKKKLDENNYLEKGIKELFQFLTEHKIISIIASGNIIPILEYYKKLLNITHIVGSSPHMIKDTIVGISVDDFQGKDFKLKGVKRILLDLYIHQDETIAIGDSPADTQLFEYVGTSIAINPKGGIEKKVKYVIDNLSEVIQIIEKNNLLF